jgi:hypothetical protein
MNEDDAPLRDPVSIRQDYEAVRAWLVRDSEEHYRMLAGVEMGPPPDTPEFEGLDEDIRQALRSVGASLRVRVDDFFKDPLGHERCQVDEAYAAKARAYYDAVVAPRIAADAQIRPEERQDRLDRAKCAEPGRQPVPYAVLVTGSDAQLVERMLPGRDVHSSLKWAEAQFSPQDWVRKLKVDVAGHGKGLVGGLPGFNTASYADFTWLFYWEPKYLLGKTSTDILAQKTAFDWSCQPTLEFLGSIFINAWDQWYDSKYAEVSLDISVRLTPIGPPYPLVPLPFPPQVYGVKEAKRLLHLSGQNILKLVQLKPNQQQSLGPVHPNPLFKFSPHFIAVSVKTAGVVRGSGSHVVVDFDTGSNDIFLNFMQVWEADV